MGRRLGSYRLSPRSAPSPIRGTVEGVAALEDDRDTVRIELAVASTAPRPCRVDRLRLVWPGGERVLRPDSLVAEPNATTRLTLTVELGPADRQRVLAGDGLEAEILAIKWDSSGHRG